MALGIYFILVTRPYQRLLNVAGLECVQIYNGWRRGEVWEVVVSVGSQTERHWVTAAELGRFLFRQALGNFYVKEKRKAKAIEAETAVALGEAMAWEWVQKRGTVVMEFDKKPLRDFSSSRREILHKVGALMSGQVALLAREQILDS